MGETRRAQGLAPLAACALALFASGALLVAGAAMASPVRLHWSTYLRAGPGETFQAIDELEHDKVVDLRGCASGWCRIVEGGSSGYVDQDSLSLAAPLRMRSSPGVGAAGAPSCFDSAQAGYVGGDATRFCQIAPPAPTARP